MHISARGTGLLCAICIDTTGSNPKESDLLEVCVMPLDRTFDRDRNYSSFYAMVKPIHEFRKETDHYRDEEYTRTHTTRGRIKQYNHAAVYGMEYVESADVFERWFKRTDKKRIIPLVYDWQHVSSFLRKWVGDSDFDEIFDYRYRDILPLACAENDHAEYNLDDIPFAKVDFSYVGTKLSQPPAVLQLPTMERTLRLGKMYFEYHMKRNSWR